jgi:beta-glucuronidase
MSEVFKMPVPASFNDVTTSARVRDFVGVAWYQRHFRVPSSWLGEPRADKKLVIRFGGVHYKATVVRDFLTCK